MRTTFFVRDHKHVYPVFFSFFFVNRCNQIREMDFSAVAPLTCVCVCMCVLYRFSLIYFTNRYFNSLETRACRRKSCSAYFCLLTLHSLVWCRINFSDQFSRSHSSLFISQVISYSLNFSVTIGSYTLSTQINNRIVSLCFSLQHARTQYGPRGTEKTGMHKMWVFPARVHCRCTGIQRPVIERHLLYTQMSGLLALKTFSFPWHLDHLGSHAR